MTTTTCRVTFGQGSSTSDPFTVLELDDTLNLDAEGEVKTTFSATDTIWFVLHVQPGYVPSITYQTDGQVTYCGKVARSRTIEGALWTPEETSIELSYYPVGEVAVEWQGNDIALASINGRTLSVASDSLTVMARANLSFSIDCYLYRFDPPTELSLEEDETYSIDAMITIEAKV